MMTEIEEAAPRNAAKPIRWTVNRAVTELGLDAKTLTKRLATGNFAPGEDDCYSTQQIFAAVGGDDKAEKRRKTIADADTAELKNKRLSGALVPRDRAIRFCSSVAIIFREYVRGCRALPEKTRLELLAEMADLASAEKIRKEMDGK